MKISNLSSNESSLNDELSSNVLSESDDDNDHHILNGPTKNKQSIIDDNNNVFDFQYYEDENDEHDGYIEDDEGDNDGNEEHFTIYDENVNIVCTKYDKICFLMSVKYRVNNIYKYIEKE